MILKTSLCYSNPAVIRQFYIGEDSTVGDLLMLIAIVHGWDADTKLRLYDGEIMLDSSLNLGKQIRQLESGDKLNAKMNIERSAYYFRGNGSQPKEWNFRIDVLEEEGEYSVPCLIRYRGLHPYLKSSSIKFNNDLTHDLLKGNRDYYYYSIDADLEKQLVNPDEINRQLLRKLVLRKEDIVLYERCGGNLKKILEVHNLDKLRSIIREKGLDIRYSHPKWQLIEELAEAYDNDEFWKALLEELDMKEYKSLKKLCLATNYLDTIDIGIADLHTLYEYGLLAWTQDEDIIIPAGLLHFFGRYLEDHDEDTLVYMKKVKAVLEVANCLYGVYTKPMCKQLAVVMYPGEIDPADISKVWRNEANRRLYNAFIMYNTDNFMQNQIFDFTRNNAFGNAGSYYIPDQNEALDILENGLNFEKNERNELEMILRRFYFTGGYDNDVDPDYLIREIYAACHVEISSEGIRKFLFDEIGLGGSKQNINKLMKTIEKCRRKVRTIKYYGFTEEEVNARKASH